MKRALVMFGCLFLTAAPARAYIGPGVGATMIGWFIGFAVTMGAAVSALIVWPLRMLRSRRREGASIDRESHDRQSAESDVTEKP